MEANIDDLVDVRIALRHSPTALIVVRGKRRHRGNVKGFCGAAGREGLTSMGTEAGSSPRRWQGGCTQRRLRARSRNNPPADRRSRGPWRHSSNRVSLHGFGLSQRRFPASHLCARRHSAAQFVLARVYRDLRCATLCMMYSRAAPRFGFGQESPYPARRASSRQGQLLKPRRDALQEGA
eukprot:1483665-Rhodomonas_salina.2